MEKIHEATHIANAEARRVASVPALNGEYLTFRLGAEEYGIDILKVQEIRSYEPPTRIANTPDFVKGVVNLRGIIVPVIDLRLNLGCERAEYDAFTVVIVLCVRGKTVGVVVDAVSEVVTLGDEAIRPAPEMPTRFEGNVIIGIGRVQERMIVLIDIVALLSSEHMGLVAFAQ